MSKNIKEKPETFEEAFKLAKKYPDHTIRFFIPEWRVTLIMEEDRANEDDDEDEKLSDKEFIKKYSGSWKGSETAEEIIKMIESSRTSFIPEKLK